MLTISVPKAQLVRKNMCRRFKLLSLSSYKKSWSKSSIGYALGLASLTVNASKAQLVQVHMNRLCKILSTLFTISQTIPAYWLSNRLMN